MLHGVEVVQSRPARARSRLRPWRFLGARAAAAHLMYGAVRTMAVIARERRAGGPRKIPTREREIDDVSDVRASARTII